MPISLLIEHQHSILDLKYKKNDIVIKRLFHFNAKLNLVKLIKIINI